MRFTLGLMTGMLLALPAGASAQDHGAGEAAGGPSTATYEIDPHAVPVPFGPGEHLEYRLSLGPFGVGLGSMSIDTVESVQGSPAYRFHWTIRGSALFGAARIDDDYRSWMDTRSLMTRRYIKDVKQNDYVRRKHYEMCPEELTWDLVGEDDSGDLASALPLDEISFVYYLRTLDLRVGQSLSLTRYFKADGNPVRLDVLRRDTRETEAGAFSTIVVRPVIPGANLFDEGDDAEIHLSDDENRYVVYMKSETGVLGLAVALELMSATPGQRIHGESTRSALGSGEPPEGSLR